MAVFKGASDDMYVGQRSLQVQKQMDTFFFNLRLKLP